MYKQSVVLLCVLFGALQVAAMPASGQTITQELKSTPDGQLFYVEVKVGEPGEQQTFNLLVASDYLITWLPSVELNPERGYRNKSRSKPECYGFVPKSFTGHGGYKTLIHLNRVEFGSQVIANQQFEVAYGWEGYSNSFPVDSKLDGMLGMTGLQPARDNTEYLFRNLYLSSRINHLQYSLYINNSANLNDPEQPKGALVFGGIDEKYYTGEINYVQVNGQDRRALNITSLRLDWSKVVVETGTSMGLANYLSTGVFLIDSPLARLNLDSTAKLFVGPKKVLDKIHMDILGAISIGANNGLYVFPDCNLHNKPDFLFSLGGQLEVRMTPDDYVLRGQVETLQVCFSAFKPYDEGNKIPSWVFGTRFLRKYYTIFDYEKDLVGFATPK